VTQSLPTANAAASPLGPDPDADWLAWLRRWGCHALADGAPVTAQDAHRLACELPYVRWSLRDWLNAYAHAKRRFDKLVAKAPIVGTSTSAQCRIALHANRVAEWREFLAACEQEIARWESRYLRTLAVVPASHKLRRRAGSCSESKLARAYVRFAEARRPGA